LKQFCSVEEIDEKDEIEEIDAIEEPDEEKKWHRNRFRCPSFLRREVS